MNTNIRLLSAFAIQVFAFTAVPVITMAQEVLPKPQSQKVLPNSQRQGILPNSQQRMMQKICAFDAVDSLLPSPSSQQNHSSLSYLQEQGFIQNPDGSWVCYVSDPSKQSHYYTLFKVQEINGKLIASSFLENGNLIQGQDKRSLDLFMMLIEHHTNTQQGNRQSIRRYLEAFISFVKQGKISQSRRGYLFDQPSNGLVLYHPLTNTKLQGSAITININMYNQALVPVR
jgi:hypothetical protein